MESSKSSSHKQDMPFRCQTDVICSKISTKYNKKTSLIYEIEYTQMIHFIYQHNVNYYSKYTSTTMMANRSVHRHY